MTASSPGPDYHNQKGHRDILTSEEYIGSMTASSPGLMLSNCTFQNQKGHRDILTPEEYISSMTATSPGLLVYSNTFNSTRKIWSSDFVLQSQYGLSAQH